MTELTDSNESRRRSDLGGSSTIVWCSIFSYAFGGAGWILAPDAKDASEGREANWGEVRIGGGLKVFSAKAIVDA